MKRHPANLIATGLALLLPALAGGGCATAPFAPEPPVSASAWDPAAVREDAIRNQPPALQAVHSLVFDYRFHSLTALGVVNVRPADGTFSAVGMTPVGVKLFELAGKDGAVETRFVMDALKERGGDAGAAIGADIARIYLDTVPAPGAAVRRTARELIFSQPSGDGRMEYSFGGAHRLLQHKRWLDRDGAAVWDVGYYDYRLVQGRWFPHGVWLRHFQHHYSLTARAKEIRFP